MILEWNSYTSIYTDSVFPACCTSKTTIQTFLVEGDLVDTVLSRRIPILAKRTQCHLSTTAHRVQRPFLSSNYLKSCEIMCTASSLFQRRLGLPTCRSNPSIPWRSRSYIPTSRYMTKQPPCFTGRMSGCGCCRACTAGQTEQQRPIPSISRLLDGLVLGFAAYKAFSQTSWPER